MSHGEFCVKTQSKRGFLHFRNASWKGAKEKYQMLKLKNSLFYLNWMTFFDIFTF